MNLRSSVGDNCSDTGRSRGPACHHAPAPGARLCQTCRQYRTQPSPDRARSAVGLVWTVGSAGLIRRAGSRRRPSPGTEPRAREAENPRLLRPPPVAQRSRRDCRAFENPLRSRIRSTLRCFPPHLHHGRPVGTCALSHCPRRDGRRCGTGVWLLRCFSPSSLDAKRARRATWRSPAIESMELRQIEESAPRPRNCRSTRR